MACFSAALAHEPSYQVRGVLTDGFDSTVSSMRTLFPKARLGFCLRHALNKLPSKLIGLSVPIRKGFRAKFHALLHRCRQRKSLRVFALGQLLRHFANRIDKAVEKTGERVLVRGRGLVCGTRGPADAGDEHGVGPSAQRHRPQALRHERLPPSRRGQGAFLTGLAHLYNLIPYQRRALNAGKCGVEIEGGRVPTSGWCSTCRSSRQVAIDQRGWALPRNSVECENSYLIPQILYLKGLRPREQLAQSAIDLVNNLLNGDVWIYKLQMKNDAVILVNGNAMKSYGVLMRVAPESLDDWTVDPGFAQVQDALAQYIGDAIAYIDIDIVFRHAQDAIEFMHLSILCLSLTVRSF